MAFSPSPPEQVRMAMARLQQAERWVHDAELLLINAAPNVDWIGQCEDSRSRLKKLNRELDERVRGIE